MLQTTAFALLFGFWAFLYLIDSFLKNHQKFSPSYMHLLNRTGLSVYIIQLRFYTTYFNRFFVRFGSSRTQFLKTWFTLGVMFGMIAMFVSMFLLFMIIVNTLRQQPVEQQVLTPVMPGVNLPMNQIVYYLLTLFVCGVFHELGHAIAAVTEEVHVNGFGIFIMALYPGAFVDLSTEHLQVISPVRQLRIFCAGIWHNFVIVIFAITALLFLPLFLLPFYHSGHSILVTNVIENSPVSGPKGLSVGDRVTSIDECRVKNINDWINCLQMKSEEKQKSGFCLSLDVLSQLDVSTTSYKTLTDSVECCSNATNTHLCFGYKKKRNSASLYACLPARSTSERMKCYAKNDCSHLETSSVCVLPSLDNTTKLLRILNEGKQAILFLGHPLDIYYSVTLSNYVPYSSLFPLNLPYILETFYKYLISLSGALAILNVVPCYALDGQWILLAVIELTTSSLIKSRHNRNLLYNIILIFGTSLLGANIVIALWVLFIR